METFLLVITQSLNVRRLQYQHAQKCIQYAALSKYVELATPVIIMFTMFSPLCHAYGPPAAISTAGQFLSALILTFLGRASYDSAVTSSSWLGLRSIVSCIPLALYADLTVIATNIYAVFFLVSPPSCMQLHTLWMFIFMVRVLVAAVFYMFYFLYCVRCSWMYQIQDADVDSERGDVDDDGGIDTPALVFSSRISSPSSARKTSSRALPDECPICLGDYRPRTRVAILACRHKFHYKCLTEWTSRNPACPMCRASQPLLMNSV